MDIALFSDTKENQIESYQNAELIDNIKESIETLSERLKRTAELYYLEGVKIREISKRLEISEGTVKTRLKIIREQLRIKLKKHGFDPADYLLLILLTHLEIMEFFDTMILL